MTTLVIVRSETVEAPLARTAFELLSFADDLVDSAQSASGTTTRFDLVEVYAETADTGAGPIGHAVTIQASTDAPDGFSAVAEVVLRQLMGRARLLRDNDRGSRRW